jgi:NADH-quinone oxidoreductase subunit C
VAEETTPPAAAGTAHGEPAKAPPAKREPVDASEHPLVRALRQISPDTVLSASSFEGELTIVVDRANLSRAARKLKDDLDFKYCVDVTAIDWRDRTPRFDVVIHLYSFSRKQRIRIKCGAAEGEEVPSIAEVYLAANWSERETFDMYGIKFAGHPDLRRILTWDGFEGYPLRKDFPVEGITTGAAIYPEEWPEGGGPAADDPNRKAVS